MVYLYSFLLGFGGGGGIFLGKKKADNWPTYVHSVLEETFNEKNVVEESLW